MRNISKAILLVLLSLLTSCAQKQPRYVIGVSQCSEDIWRDKLNRELQIGAYFHDGIELRFASADDSDERQIDQIDRFVNDGVDLLIVAPNQAATVTPAIDRAYDKGIPVIVFDRKTNSHKYTAYIGADNREMGRMMGEYVATQLKGRGRVLEILGLKGSSPAIERHEGFLNAISHYADIHLEASLQGDWTEESARQAVAAYQGDLRDIDYVFGQNDRMAMGAIQAFTATGLRPSATLFCGIDGLPGQDAGIQQVRDSLLEASCIYPTHGDEVLQLAVNILEGKPYQKENKLRTALVTPDNANVLLMQSEETERQATYLDKLHEKANAYLQQLATQRIINLLAYCVIGLLLLVILLIYLYHRGKITLRKQRIVSNLWNMEGNNAGNSSNDQTTKYPNDQLTTTPADQSPIQLTPLSEASSGGSEASLFISRFKDAVEAKLADSDLSVEELATDMNLSRVQLYRRVKAITGSSPVELLRAARLNRGYQLLLTTDKTISEVAYAVGFTSPGYFSKCFKEAFGHAPGDTRTSCN